MSEPPITEIVLVAQQAEPSIRYEQARRLIEAAAPALRAQGAATERARAAAIISPLHLRMLADWFDVDDELKRSTFWPSAPRDPDAGDQVQRDLRALADLLDPPQEGTTP